MSKTSTRRQCLPPTMRTPCTTCPFRSDIDFVLSKPKLRSILSALRGDEDFACHNTTVATGCAPGNEKGCIGAAIFLEHTRVGGVRANLSFRLRETLRGEFERAALDMTAPVFRTEAAFTAARQERVRPDV